MSAAGVSGAAIATALGITRRTVSTARTRWNRGGLGALSDGHSPGRPPKADAGYVARLLWVVERDPRDLGYAFTRWTAPRLAAYLRSQTGIEVSAAWVSQLLRSRHYVWRRTKLTIRNLQDPAAVKRARRALSALKKKPRNARPTSSCGSATA